jgi:seryl-tRNA synthetase
MTVPRSSFTVPLPRPVDLDLAADLEKQAVYASIHIRRLRVNAERNGVEVVSEDGANEAEVRVKVERYLDTMVSRFRKLRKKALMKNERRDAAPYEKNVYAELKRRGWVRELGRGQAGLAGPALRLAQALDARCAALATERFAALPESYPALIPADVLGRCGYFASFPQSVSLVSHLVEDYDLIEEFRVANAGSPRLSIPRPAALPTPEACLTPAVCYHTYQSLEGTRIGAAGRAITSMGRCFRYESKNIAGLDRLWDFGMREIVFVGTESWVSAQRERAIEAVSGQVAEWDLDCVIETANDPFFPTVHTNKAYWQQRADLKFEVRLSVEPEADGTPRSLACGSLNLHENFFGRTFGIVAADAQPAFTGCVAWGLERWVLAGFTQHGYDPERWPATLRREIFG